MEGGKSRHTLEALFELKTEAPITREELYEYKVPPSQPKFELNVDPVMIRVEREDLKPPP